ncbi:DUF885 family protein [Dasania sp. GY-MA-18]|uniref:DUF885 family protein n=1 Tax=Dasania phycosphaerae TaxID=2950436 RepID=A0A9J6RMX9_9GAMM|nr:MULTISPECIES: DUF885 family protein [Dasania]MCR8922918.1 DUF885 family protein [Dasania sp. GY-MA-18]MCZ0865349.1 DUF885 family protein [Dasania phycosphaerae]MCZ0869074.1 DUF885 family protein [Dasania phycosphaerae]
MRPIKTLLSLAIATGLVACTDPSATTPPLTPKTSSPLGAEQQMQNTASAAFLAMMDEYSKTLLRLAPTLATSLGVTEDYLGIKFNDKLGDYSVNSIATAKALRARMAADLSKINRAALSGTAATTYDVVAASLAMTEKFEPYVFGGFSPLNIFTPYPVSQLSGIHIELPRALQTEHPLNNANDVEDYLTRLSLLGPALSEHADVVRFDAKQGVTPPQFAIQGALNVIASMTKPAAADNPLASSLGSRLTAVTEITAQQRATYVARAATIINDKVYPGYAALAAALQEILPQAQTEAGIWALADGEKRYQLALQNYGAGDKTPEQVHQLGLAEVKRIQGEIDSLLTSLGRSEGDVMTRFIAMTEEPSFLYPNTDAGRQKLLADLNKQMQTVEALLPNILLTLPKASVEVRRIAEYEQDSAPGGYYTSPSLDGSRPGIYWINLKDTADWPRFSLPTLTYHEASPGHHLQTAIAQEIKDMPMIRNTLWFSPYGEGWALYAELLAKELGLYKDDPYGDLGRLQSELFRSARLVVDTGLHYKKWSREQAIAWMHKNTGESVAAVTREIERYSVWPGQATSYKMGQIRILELRALAKQKLGAQFDLREFNDQVLIHGAVPLAVLSNNINAWINSKL